MGYCSLKLACVPRLGMPTYTCHKTSLEDVPSSLSHCHKSLSHFLPTKNPILWVNTSILIFRLSDCLTWTPQQPDSHTENYFVCIRWSICFSRTPLLVSKNSNILPSHITGLQSSSHLMSFKHRCKENHIGHNLSYQNFGKTAQDPKYYFLGYTQNVKTAKLECHSVREPRGRKDFAGQVKDTWKSCDVLGVNEDSTKNHQVTFSNQTRWSSSTTSQLQVTMAPAMELHCRWPTGTKGQQIRRLQLQDSQHPGKKWGFKHSWKQDMKI